MDSYYLDKASRELLNNDQVKFIAAAIQRSNKELHDFVRRGICKAGEWRIACNETKHEAVVYYHNMNEDIGKNLVSSNAFTKKL
eukprot:scaffold381_cov168-Ochromonas_danica.AAC.19